MFDLPQVAQGEDGPGDQGNGKCGQPADLVVLPDLLEGTPGVPRRRHGLHPKAEEVLPVRSLQKQPNPAQIRKRLIKQLDVLLPKIVKARDARCQHCGEAVFNLECSHFIKRRYMRVRWDLENVDALCHDCHGFVEVRKDYRRDWKVARAGEEAVRRLEGLRFGHGPFTLDELKGILAHLKAQARFYGVTP